MIWVLLVAAAIILSSLVVAAFWYRHRATLVVKARESATEARQEAVLQGLEVLARAIVQRQVNLTEGALRISALLDNLSTVPQPLVDTSAIHQLAEAASGFAVGRQREALEAAERRRQDKARQSLEAQYDEAVRSAAARLLDVIPQWRLSAE